jgi:hypothetical protein
LLQGVADPARGRVLLVEDDQNRLSHDERESKGARLSLVLLSPANSRRRDAWPL